MRIVARIRPRYKRQVADRLALGAYNVAYGETDKGRYQGPYPSSFYLDEDVDAMVIEYDDGDVELLYRGDGGFEVTRCYGNGD